VAKAAAAAAAAASGATPSQWLIKRQRLRAQQHRRPSRISSRPRLPGPAQRQRQESTAAACRPEARLMGAVKAAEAPQKQGPWGGTSFSFCVEVWS
jgi:hypothetical protein